MPSAPPQTEHVQTADRQDWRVTPLPRVVVGGWLTARVADLIQKHGLQFVHECTPVALGRLPGFGPVTIHQIQKWIATHQFTEGTTDDTDGTTDNTSPDTTGTGTDQQPSGVGCVRDAATTGHHSWRWRRHHAARPAGDDDTQGTEPAAAAETEPPLRHVPDSPAEVHEPTPTAEELTARLSHINLHSAT